jgi:hypothetical protein
LFKTDATRGERQLFLTERKKKEEGRDIGRKRGLYRERGFLFLDKERRISSQLGDH